MWRLQGQSGSGSRDNMLKLSFIITINVHNIYAVLVFSMFILAGSDVYTAVLLSRPADRVRVWNTARAASADIDGHQKRDVYKLQY